MAASAKANLCRGADLGGQRCSLCYQSDMNIRQVQEHNKRGPEDEMHGCDHPGCSMWWCGACNVQLVAVHNAAQVEDQAPEDRLCPGCRSVCSWQLNPHVAQAFKDRYTRWPCVNHHHLANVCSAGDESSVGGCPFLGTYEQLQVHTHPETGTCDGRLMRCCAATCCPQCDGSPRLEMLVQCTVAECEAFFMWENHSDHLVEKHEAVTTFISCDERLFHPDFTPGERVWSGLVPIERSHEKKFHVLSREHRGINGRLLGEDELLITVLANAGPSWLNGGSVVLVEVLKWGPTDGRQGKRLGVGEPWRKGGEVKLTISCGKMQWWVGCPRTVQLVTAQSVLCRPPFNPLDQPPSPFFAEDENDDRMVARVHWEKPPLPKPWLREGTFVYKPIVGGYKGRWGFPKEAGEDFSMCLSFEVHE